MRRRDLAARADADANAMHDILVAQRERIEKTNKVAPQLQLQFEFADEVRQFQANRRHWEKRLDRWMSVLVIASMSRR